jgi:cell division septation protein DedD
MTKKIIGSIGILVGLGLATFLVYTALFPEGDLRPSPSDPAVQSQAAGQPQSKSPSEAATSQPESAASRDPANAPSTASAPAPSDPIALAAKAPAAGAPAHAAPAAKPTPPAAKIEKELRTPLEPTEEHGLLAGRYRGYASANKRMEKIKKQGLPAFVRPQGKYYEVWAGPFATPAEAEQARKSLKAVRICAKKGKLTIPVPK